MKLLYFSNLFRETLASIDCREDGESGKFVTVKGDEYCLSYYPKPSVGMVIETIEGNPDDFVGKLNTMTWEKFGEHHLSGIVRGEYQFGIESGAVLKIVVAYDVGN